MVKHLCLDYKTSPSLPQHKVKSSWKTGWGLGASERCRATTHWRTQGSKAARSFLFFFKRRGVGVGGGGRAEIDFLKISFF